MAIITFEKVEPPVDQFGDPLVEEAECEECGDYFEYEVLNIKLPRKVCHGCVKKWRVKYVSGR
jgi:formylmethanofuran dehydrogenase subunit E